MNKYLIVVAIAILLLAVGLSGCNEQTGISSEESKFVGTWIDDIDEIIVFYEEFQRFQSKKNRMTRLPK